MFSVAEIRERVKRGDFIIAETVHSICLGYVEGIYDIGGHAFINLAGTRKREQGRNGEDWFDHIYSLRIDRIVSIETKELR
jgi:hypothetical protein